jgi:hypothetical protein
MAILDIVNDSLELGKALIDAGKSVTDLIKAKTNQIKANSFSIEPTAEDPKSLFFDPYSIIENMGYKDRPTPISYSTLFQIFWKLPIVQAIHFLRIKQVAAFGKPQTDRYSLGFRTRMRDRKRNPSKVELKQIEYLENLIMSTGVTDNPKGRDSFKTLLKKVTWDSLLYDQFCIEKVLNRKGLPAAWYAVDATTIRIADNGKTFIDTEDRKAIRYVQIYDGMIINQFTQDNMIFGVRNPSSNIRLHGYGVSELEMLITNITAMINTRSYNTKAFSQGIMAKGILNFEGTIPNARMEEFRRHWYNLLASVDNAHRMPVMNAEGIKYINLQTTNREMEYSAWMDYLIKEACSVYATDPAEINFDYGKTGQKAALSESSSADKIMESKERGLRPLLEDIEDAINLNIIQEINPDFIFEFIGLDPDTKDKVVSRNMQRVKSFMTVNELRAEEDLPALPEEEGNIILDAYYFQNKQALAAAQQQEEGGSVGEGIDKENGKPIDESVDVKDFLKRMMEEEEGAEAEEAPGPEKNKSAKTASDLEGVEKSLEWNITL